MTSGYLLDTNILSELRRKAPDAGLMAWWDAAPEHLLYVSVLTLGEIRYGTERLAARDARAAANLDRWINDLVELFSERILVVDEHVAEQWGRLRVPRPLPTVDALLAATAIVSDLTLVTRNARDVEGTGARTLNPFST